MATQRIQKGSFAIDKILYDFIENEALPLSNVSSDEFWAGFEAIVKDLTPKNKALLARRDELQAQIDEWHENNTYELEAYKQFLTDIGYLEPGSSGF